MVGMMLAVAVASAIVAPPVIVEGSRGWHSDRHALLAALTAPQRARRINEQRLCFDDTMTRLGSIRRVCRSRRDWNRLGLDPVMPALDDRQSAQTEFNAEGEDR